MLPSLNSALAKIFPLSPPSVYGFQGAESDESDFSVVCGDDTKCEIHRAATVATAAEPLLAVAAAQTEPAARVRPPTQPPTQSLLRKRQAFSDS